MDLGSTIRGFRYCALLSAAACSVFASADLGHQTTVRRSARLASVVRADVRTGRLVRTVVVTPVVVPAKLVQAPVVGATPSAVPESELTIPDLVEKTARKYDVDPLLVHSVIQVESNYNPRALSPKGAQGLMQLMPDTARRFGVRDTFDAKDNIEGGVRYLRFLTDLFPNDTRLAVAAYNAGEGAVSKYRNNIPPYRETEQYVYKVGERYGRAKRAVDRKKSAAAKPAQTEATIVPTPAEPEYAHVDQFVDSAGRLHLRTAVPNKDATIAP